MSFRLSIGVWLTSARFRRTLAMLVILGVVVWRAVVWALQPAWWTGSHLGGGEDMAWEEARGHFGPVLLTTTLIRDRPEAWHGLNREEVLRDWGNAETTARLLLSVAALFVLFSVVALWRSWIGATPLVAANRDEPDVSKLPSLTGGGSS